VAQENLQKIIESLLFVSEKPLTVKQIIEVCEHAQAGEVKAALKKLIEDYNEHDHGIQIREVAGGFQFSSHPDCSEYLKKLYKTRRVFRLSAPALETLAIIAYKQPVTRAEIEFIRGVNVDGVIRTLEERKLIKIRGRKEVPGRPLIYGTTEAFLNYFGLKSLQDLPPLEEFIAGSLNVEQLEASQANQNNRELADNEQALSLDKDQEINPEKNNEGKNSNGKCIDEQPVPEKAEKGDEYDEYKEIAQGN